MVLLQKRAPLKKAIFFFFIICGNENNFHKTDTFESIIIRLFSGEMCITTSGLNKSFSSFH
jgi:hypothetical protein